MLNKQASIVFDGVSKSYEDNLILNNFNLEIYKGEFLTIIGSSGCGKTTLLKLINGLLIPDKGTVYVKGDDISKIDLISLRRNIGYVIQGIGLFPHMNIKKNISYVLSLIKPQDKNHIELKSRELIKLVGMDEEKLDR